jgi:sulfonate transport system permease protein
MSGTNTSWTRYTLPVLGFVLPVALWEAYVSTAQPSAAIAPSLISVARLLGELGWDVVAAAGTTFVRVLGSWVLGGLVLGLGAGLACGRFRPVDRLLHPPLSFIATIPIVTFVPLFILWIGIDSAVSLACGVMAAFFPSFLAARRAMTSPPRTLMEAAHNLGLREAQVMRHVVFPSMMPVLASGWKSGLQLACLVVPVAEMLLRSGGAGALIGRGIDLARADFVLAGQAVLGVIGVLIFAGAELAERRMLRWNDVKPR